MKPPWDRNRVVMTPNEFECKVKKHLENFNGNLEKFKVEHLERVSSPDGDYTIDVTCRFEALGVKFLVLVECKHHTNPIKREVVQILHNKIQNTGAHKGIIYSTAPFQKVAIKYANGHGIALVHFVESEPHYETRNLYSTNIHLKNTATNDNKEIDPYFVSFSESGDLLYSGKSKESLFKKLEKTN